MARHVLHGELTVFFWNQNYGGSQESILAAPVLARVADANGLTRTLRRSRFAEVRSGPFAIFVPAERRLSRSPAPSASAGRTHPG